ncbi:MAG TPA: HAD-IA family hydrolase [Prosthecobacter sp.]|nr:HAD-IA family hydrolase [Prosthecobacter sp.]
MPLRLISFDAAGTLIGVREPVGETYAAHAARHGIYVAPAALKLAFRSLWAQVPPPHWPEGQVSPDDDRGWWKGFAEQVFAQALGQPVEPARFEPLFDDLYRHYADASAWVVFEDVVPTLEALSPDYELCVLSNFDRRLVRILEGHGLARHFRRVILSSEVGAAKPHPRMFETALRHFDVSPEECLHVGDDDRCDVQAARQNGWQAFAVNRPDEGLADLVEKVRCQHIPACNRAKDE